MQEPSAQLVSRAVDLLLNRLLSEPLLAASNDDMNSSQTWDLKERPYVVAQRLFCAEITRRASDLRKQRNAAISPFSRLPTELQILVFVEALQAQQSPSTLRDLVEVSSHWRDVIEGTPSLWSAIDLNERADSVAKALRLSSGAPLTIEANTSEEEIEVEELQRFMTVLKPHAFRCRSVAFTDALLDDLRPFLGCKFPQLEVLRLEACWQDKLLIRHMPRLRILTLSGVDVPCTSGELRALKEFSLSSDEVPIPDLLDFLQECPGLQKLAITRTMEAEEGEEEGNNPAFRSPIDLSHLQSLSLGNNSPAITRQIFAIVEANILEELAVQENAIYWNAFLSIIEAKSSPVISKFSARAAFDSVGIELGSVMHPTELSVTGSLGGREVFSFRSLRSDVERDLVTTIQTMRGLFRAAWSDCPVTLNVKSIGLEWKAEFLQELWDILDVATLTFERNEAWRGVVDSLDNPGNPWPRLGKVIFPDTPLLGGEACPALRSAKKLVRLRGGEILSRRPCPRRRYQFCDHACTI